LFCSTSEINLSGTSRSSGGREESIIELSSSGHHLLAAGAISMISVPDADKSSQKRADVSASPSSSD